MRITWHEEAWDNYLTWQYLDRKMVKKINELVKDIERNGPSTGLGKPERLSGNLSDCYSRRINDKDRLVYRIKGEELEILSCKTHYGGK